MSHARLTSRKTSRFNEETKTAAVAAIVAGARKGDVAEMFCCSTAALEDWMRAAGVTKPRAKADRSAEMERMGKPGRKKSEMFQKPRCSRCGMPFLARSRTAILCSQCQTYANQNDF